MAELHQVLMIFGGKIRQSDLFLNLTPSIQCFSTFLLNSHTTDLDIFLTPVWSSY